ncbi:unnamed protein product [Enterobius vermicularis]|uniref:thioredoxin-dependent peroxiredoxin n=1 Tax=Enterobius vermicularis TaxID=51028 RepID=A0A0N4VDW1_ENTVE|nr:unnamed protein product [Enterobius vermicularis]
MGRAMVGKPAPEFSADSVSDLDFTTVSLSDYNGRYIILLFYPNDFSRICSAELLAFSNEMDQFKALGCSILAISTDSKFAHFAWSSQPTNVGGVNGIRYPLCADKNYMISREYGVMNEDEGTSHRGLFVIDSAGVIRFMSVNDLCIERSVDEVIRIVSAIQYADKYGTTCPADWKPRKLTLTTESKAPLKTDVKNKENHRK